MQVGGQEVTLEQRREARDRESQQLGAEPARQRGQPVQGP